MNTVPVTLVRMLNIRVLVFRLDAKTPAMLTLILLKHYVYKSKDKQDLNRTF